MMAQALPLPPRIPDAIPEQKSAGANCLNISQRHAGSQISCGVYSQASNLIVRAPLPTAPTTATSSTAVGPTGPTGPPMIALSAPGETHQGVEVFRQAVGTHSAGSCTTSQLLTVNRRSDAGALGEMPISGTKLPSSMWPVVGRLRNPLVDYMIDPSVKIWEAYVHRPIVRDPAPVAINFRGVGSSDSRKRRGGRKTKSKVDRHTSQGSTSSSSTSSNSSFALSRELNIHSATQLQAMSPDDYRHKKAKRTCGGC